MILSIDDIWALARGFQPSRILLTAVELGIFAALNNKTKTSAEIASVLKTDERATDRLMNALAAMELIEKEGDKFRNAPAAAGSLVPGKPGYIGGALMHTVNMWNSWSTMTAAVRAGTSVLKREGADRDDWVAPFIAAMHANSSQAAQMVVPSINLEEIHRVLDVGGGSGAYSMEFCRAKPGLEAVVFDLPDVIPLTKQYVEQAGLLDRINFTAGDYQKDELGSNFDMAFLSAIIHSNSPEENIELIRKCYRALNPGGKIVIQDFIMDESRTSPAHGAIFALNMLVATKSGDTYTEKEVVDWFEKAGFIYLNRVDIPGAGTSLLMARKE
jgi:ubiquinone/menaquinone biosynthesis C-methylase UbiE